MTNVAPNVLIAETDDVSRLFLADNLEADGYRPVCAVDTAAALERLSEGTDALIVDVNGDTLGVIDAIREQTDPGVDPQLPILVLTSHSAELHRTRLLERERKQAASRRNGSQPDDPAEDARREHGRRVRELADQAHGANLDLGWALMNNLATVDPTDISVARFSPLCGDPHSGNYAEAATMPSEAREGLAGRGS